MTVMQCLALRLIRSPGRLGRSTGIYAMFALACLAGASNPAPTPATFDELSDGLHGTR